MWDQVRHKQNKGQLRQNRRLIITSCLIPPGIRVENRLPRAFDALHLPHHPSPTVMNPTPPSSSSPDRAAEEELPFELAISRIEDLVTRMEAERLPLDDLIAAYDEGTRLLEVCRHRLDDAQRRVEMITVRADGSSTLSPFAGDEAPTAEEGSSRSRQR